MPNVTAFTQKARLVPDSATIAPPASDPTIVVPQSTNCSRAFASGRSSSLTRFGTPARTAGRKNALPIPATSASADDRLRVVDERQRGEHGQAAEIRHDHQALPRQAIDERAEQEADSDRRHDVRGEEGADPPARVRAVVHLDLQGEQRQPGADAGGEVREEQPPELDAVKHREAVMASRRRGRGGGHAGASTRSSAVASASISSGVPTVMRTAVGAPKPARGRTTIPSRSSRS